MKSTKLKIQLSKVDQELDHKNKLNILKMKHEAALLVEYLKSLRKIFWHPFAYYAVDSDKRLFEGNREIRIKIF